VDQVLVLVRLVEASAHRRPPQVHRLLRVVSVVRLQAVVLVARLPVLRDQADSAARRQIHLEAPPRGEGDQEASVVLRRRDQVAKAVTVVRLRKVVVPTVVRRKVVRPHNKATVARRRKISISK
jgi:hypothetical protein